MKKLLILISLICPVLVTAQYKVFSQTITSKKVIVVTRYAKGYVLEKSGQRKEGEIQIKVVNGDTIEIRLKGTGKKQIFERSELLEFGLAENIGETTNTEKEGITRVDREKFQEGFVVVDGKKYHGKVAVEFNKIGEPYRDYFVYAIKFQYENQVSRYTTENGNVEFFSQTIKGKAHQFHRYQDGFSKIMRKGVMLLAQNPYSTSKRGTLSKGWGELTKLAADEVNKLGFDDKEGDKAADQLNSIDTDIYLPEYLIKREGVQEFELVIFDNYENWLKQFMTGCAAYSDVSGAERRNLEKFKEIRKAIDFFNEKCEDGEIALKGTDN